MSCLVILILLAVIEQGSTRACNSLPELEAILYEGPDNIKQLSEAFFPSNDRTSRFLEIDYRFEGNETNEGCTVTYYWSTGGFLLIQPPQVFKFTSLFLNFDSNDLPKIELILPAECLHIVYNSSTENCSCEVEGNTILDVLTHHLFQYAKYTTYEQVIRDETSAVRSVCKQELSQYKNPAVTAFLTLIIIMPVGSLVLVSFFLQKKDTEVEKILFKSKSHYNFTGLIITGYYLTIYILIMDMLAVNYATPNENEYDEFSFNEYVTIFTLIFDLLATVLSIATCLIYFCDNRCDHDGNRCKWISSLFLICMVGIEKRNKLFKDKDKQKLDMWILLSTMYAPIYCLSAHIGYVFVAWLTEPDKTAATALAAFMLIIFFFLGSRKFFEILVDLSCTTNQSGTNNTAANKKNDKGPSNVKEKPANSQPPASIQKSDDSSTPSQPQPHSGEDKTWCCCFYTREGYQPIKGLEDQKRQARKNWTCRAKNCWTIEKNAEKFNFKVFLYALFLAFFLSVPIVAIFATFYYLPIPTFELTNYLQNIVQIFLVLIASLIYYKVLSFKESDVERFLKKLNENYKDGNDDNKDKNPPHNAGTTEFTEGDDVIRNENPSPSTQNIPSADSGNNKKDEDPPQNDGTTFPKDEKKDEDEFEKTGAILGKVLKTFQNKCK